MASWAPIIIQNENLPIFRGIDGKKAGGARGPAARAGRQERKALGDLSKVGKVPPASAGGKATAAGSAGRQERKALGDLSKVGKVPPASAGGKATAAGSVGGSKNVVKPGYLSDEEWMKCCEWAKGGIEIAIFTGNDMQKLIGDKREERIRKKVEKAMGTLQLSMDSLYNIDVPSEILVDPDDKAKLELDPEFLPSTTHFSSRIGEQDANYLLSDLEIEHEPFAYCSFDLKLKDDYGNDSSSRSTLLLP